MLQVLLDSGLRQCHGNPVSPPHRSALLCVSFTFSLHSAHWTILPLREADCSDVSSRNLASCMIMNKGWIKLFEPLSAVLHCNVKVRDKSMKLDLTKRGAAPSMLAVPDSVVRSVLTNTSCVTQNERYAIPCVCWRQWNFMSSTCSVSLTKTMMWFIIQFLIAFYVLSYALSW